MFEKIMDAILGVAEDDPDATAVDLGGFESYLAGVSWPISKDDLLKAMSTNGAGKDILDKVGQIDADSFANPGDFVAALYGGAPATRETIRTKVNELSPNLKDDLKRGNIL